MLCLPKGSSAAPVLAAMFGKGGGVELKPENV